MKIKILELNKHRNETTFRPYLFALNLFREYGIEFVENDNEADIYFVGQASVIDKKLSLEQSIENGINFIKNLDKPYVLFDGQDSSSLIGTWEVFKSNPGLKLAKNVILKNKEDYLKSYPNGRWFWGEDESGYKLSKEDLQLLNTKLVSSGTNWLNTYGSNFKWNPINRDKKYDVAVLIGLSKENLEHGTRTDYYYNKYRLKLFEYVNNLKCNIITTEKTGKLSKEQYFQTLSESKFCISPFGYGEVNIREIECLLAGTVLIKPNISKIDTNPYIFNDKISCLNCELDFSDVENVVETNLEKYNDVYENMISNSRSIFDKHASSNYIVKHVITNILN